MIFVLRDGTVLVSGSLGTKTLFTAFLNLPMSACSSSSRSLVVGVFGSAGDSHPHILAI